MGLNKVIPDEQFAIDLEKFLHIVLIDAFENKERESKGINYNLALGFCMGFQSRLRESIKEFTK